MISEEDAFLAQLNENPGEETTRLAYADWLDEHDETRKARYLRKLVELRKLTAELDDIMLDEEWTDCVGGEEDKYEGYILRHGLKLHTLKELMELRKKRPLTRTIDFNTMVGDTIMDRYQFIYFQVLDLVNYLVRQSDRRKGDVWAVATPEISSIFETTRHTFEPTKVYPGHRYLNAQSENTHPLYCGRCGGRLNLYSHVDHPQGELTIGLGRGDIPANNLCVFVIQNFII